MASIASREYPDRPWVGVGVVVWKGGRVLLVRRGRAPRLGEWSIPGGAQDLGETVFEAAIREVREETGVAIRPTGVVTVVDAIARDANARVQYHYTLVEVSAEWTGGDVVCGDDALEARWATLEEAASLLPRADTLAVIRQAADQRDRA